MASVFDPTGVQRVAGAFKAEDLTLTVAGKTAALVQSVQFTCNRTVNMLYEIGTNNVYYVGNRRQGQAQMSRVVASSAAFKDLIKNTSNICSPQRVELKVTPKGGGGALCSASNRTYTLRYATLVSIGGSVTAQDIVLTENLGFMFSDLETD